VGLGQKKTKGHRQKNFLKLTFTESFFIQKKTFFFSLFCCFETVLPININLGKLTKATYFQPLLPEQ